MKRHRRNRRQSRERESFKERRRNDLEHKARQNDLQKSKKTKCFSNCCCSRKVVYILTEHAPEGLALREISTPESLEAGESQYQRRVVLNLERSQHQ